MADVPQGPSTLTLALESVMAAPSPPRPDLVGAPEREMSTAGSKQDASVRPMAIGEMLVEGARLYRRHWKVLMLTAGLVNVPFLLIQWFMIGMASGGHVSTAGGSADGSAASGIHTIFTAANDVLVRPLVYAAMLSVVAAVCLVQRPNVTLAYRIALDRLRSVLWVMILALLGMGTVEAVGYLALDADGGLLPLRVIVGLAALGVSAVLYVRWAVFVITIVMIEGTRGRAALGRAWRLSAGAFCKIALVTLAAHVPILMVDALLKSTGETLSSNLGTFGWVAQGVAAAIASMVVTPYNVLIAVLLYLDQRLRKEPVASASSAVTDAPEANS
jgi:hypothetical protein